MPPALSTEPHALPNPQSPPRTPRCTADCGWITGHSYLTYGPLLVGASQVVFEGVPTYPAADRCWQIVDKYKVQRRVEEGWRVGGAPAGVPCRAPAL